jgi:hypothetical protein
MYITKKKKKAKHILQDPADSKGETSDLLTLNCQTKTLSPQGLHFQQKWLVIFPSTTCYRLTAARSA